MHFIVGYPGSGSTWIRVATAAYAVGSLGHDFSAEAFFGREELTPAKRQLWSDLTLDHYQSSTPFELRDLSLPSQARVRPAAMLVMERDATRAPRPDLTLVHSHHAAGSVDTIPLWAGEWTDRVVNPVRDPREICCSLASRFGADYKAIASYMESNEALYPPQFEQEDGESVGGEGNGGELAVEGFETVLHHLLLSWSSHVHSWASTNREVLSVRYEDVAESPMDAIGAILSFLGEEDLDLDLLEEAVEAASFDAMQAAEEHEGIPLRSSRKPEGPLLRSGRTDGWKDELPTEVARKIEDDHGEMMETLGYL